MGSRKSPSAASVADYIAGLTSPLREDVETLRSAILASAEGIGEEIKWNAPSFYTGEHFATMRLHGKVPLQLILHLGVKKSSIPRDLIEDPEGLLQWLAPDRACISFPSFGSVSTRVASVQNIVRQWLQHVPARVAG
ncbi:DUF1801 domain-containing protein [Thermomonas flagellata]|uniref:DUF1801 domain-containing protein n=1 Tax=Thermomonas flagellata TaxID=2888524 RepID=UPI001F0412FC|nr:DUF1801 domain-containing protein [Thermomonas flagellata]